jgi:Purple acid Phosphatase, N-terminal domain/Calcineurin-like phosphoesterase
VALLDKDELKKQQLQSQRLKKSWWILAIVAIAGWFAIVDPSNAHESAHKHTIPTLLSVVHHETGEYVNALVNPLYERLKEASFIPFDKLESQHSIIESPTLQVDRFQIHVRDPLTLSWTSGRNHLGEAVLRDNDVIVLYCGHHYISQQNLPDTRQFLDAATIAQARATSQKHDGGSIRNLQSWHFPDFPALRHEACQFALLRALPDSRGGQPRYTLLHTTAMFTMKSSRTVPTAIHLALGDTPSEMVIQFITGDKEGTPVARYTKQGSKKETKASGTSHTYTAEDMCEAPANITEAGKFQPPGMIHVIRLKDLEPNTVYDYQLGLAHGQGITWSNSHSFTSAPVIGDNQPHSYLVYGDQGCPSIGWGDGGKWTAALTAREILNPKDKNLPIRSIHHFGDLSYARGAAHIWDEWFNMISPFTSKVPLMIAVGNHEYDHLSGGANGKDPSGVLDDEGYRPLWGNFNNDSGGECGVPTANHFTMPNSTNSNGVFWYSYNFANVHTTVISSEHDLSPGSAQYLWLEADLQSVNRTLTPWLIVESHRPLYESENHWDDNATAG